MVGCVGYRAEGVGLACPEGLPFPGSSSRG